MKLSRLIVLGLAIVGVLVFAAAVTVFTPGFQTWAARRALASRPDWAVTFTRVSAGLGQVHLEGVRVVRSGAVLTLPVVDVTLPVIPAAWRQRVQISRLEAKGWTLDLTHAPTSSSPNVADTSAPHPREFSLLPSAYADTPAAPSPVVFAGIFDHLHLPVDLSLAGVDLAGEVLLPALPGRPAARAKVTLTGGNLAAGHPGKFDYTAVIIFEGAEAPVHELKVEGELGVVMDTPRSIARFVAATTAEASGPKFPENVRLEFDVSAAQSAGGENYAVVLLSGSKQLAAIETSYAAGESHLRGTWRLDLHHTDLAPFLFGRELPVFAGVGEGRFDVDTTFVELNASGRLDATADGLAAINPELAILGAVHLTADFDFAQRGDATRVERLSVTLARTKPVATVRALQAFEFNLKTGELNVADPASELLGVVFQGLPVAWVRPLLRRTGLDVTGNELQGEFAASARNGGFSIRPKSPLTVGNLTVTGADGRVFLRGVDIALTGSADYAPQGWQVACAPLAVSSGGVPLFALELRAGQLSGKDQPIKLAGDWTAHLPAVLQQRELGGVLTSGEAQGDFAASFDAKREIQIKLALTHLVSASAGELPSLQADVRADVQPDGNITFNAPFRFERGASKSDFTLAGTAVAAGGKIALTGRVTSTSLRLDDMQAFALPFLSAADASAAGPVAAPDHAAPFWRAVTGQCTLALKQFSYGDQLQLTDVSGVLRIEPAVLRLEDGRAGFGPDSTVQISGGLTAQRAGSPGYGLAADVSLGNFDVGAVFRALDPTRTPTVEGRVTLVSHLTGSGATLADLAEHTRGEMKLSGKSGIFRALSADLSDRIQKTQSRVAAIGSLLGVVTDDYVNKSKILADIAKSLSEIPFDQLSLTATRDDALNLVIKDFSLISPEVRIGGGGVIHYAPGVPVVSQALEVQLNLGARGRLGDQIKRAGLLDQQLDNLGYAPFAVPLRIGGTLARPDTSAIRDALLNSALERSGLLDSLFGRGK